jgi:ABC-type bacteriocin/lantibiotic exporter with double-glycine peptidase domain
MKQKIPFYFQEEKYTCGAACLRMALEALGIKVTEKESAQLLKTDQIRGTYHKNFRLAAEKFDLTFLEKSNSSLDGLEKLISNNWIVIINHISGNEDHYVIVSGFDENFFYFSDPWYGKERLDKISKKGLEETWHDTENCDRWLFALRLNQ